MATDIVIHDTMVSATAGIEAYLSRTRTIYFDTHNFKNSRFQKNKVPIVFNNWEKVWDSLLIFFHNQESRLGIWDDEIINEIDFFKDDNADERVGFVLSKIRVYYDEYNDVNSILNATKKDYETYYINKKKFLQFCFIYNV